MYSFDLNRPVSFPTVRRDESFARWSPDGSELAFSSSRGGEPDIYIVDAPAETCSRLPRSGSRCFADLQPQNGRADRIG